jgi:ketosteroid isomerase-like protein
MSQDYIELVRPWFERGDLAAATDLVDDSIVFDVRGMEWDGISEISRVYYGLDELRDFWRAWLPVWSETRVELKWIEGVGDRVIAWLHQRQAGRASRIPVEYSYAWDLLFRDGKIVRVAFFRAVMKARQALGLSE